MEAKPAGWASGYASWFGLQSVADRYPSRPPYPEEVFAVLTSLVAPAARTVLDAGCGVGDLARPLAPLVDRVDAVDPSSPMLVRGADLPGGDAMNLRWIHSGIEERGATAAVRVDRVRRQRSLVRLGGRVDAVFGLTRTRRLHGDRAARLVGRGRPASPICALIYASHGANPDFQPLDPVVELERRGLFERAGEHVTAPATWSPTLDTLIACHHSQNGFVLEKMRDPAAFDRELADVMADIATDDGRLPFEVVARIVWGMPIRSHDAPLNHRPTNRTPRIVDHCPAALGESSASWRGVRDWTLGPPRSPLAGYRRIVLAHRPTSRRAMYCSKGWLLAAGVLLAGCGRLLQLLRRFGTEDLDRQLVAARGIERIAR